MLLEHQIAARQRAKEEVDRIIRGKVRSSKALSGLSTAPRIRQALVADGNAPENEHVYTLADAEQDEYVRDRVFSSNTTEGLTFREIIFEDCTFEDQTLVECSFVGCKFINCRFQGNTQFYGCILSGSDFEACHFDALYLTSSWSGSRRWPTYLHDSSFTFGVTDDEAKAEHWGVLKEGKVVGRTHETNEEPKSRSTRQRRTNAEHNSERTVWVKPTRIGKFRGFFGNAVYFNSQWISVHFLSGPWFDSSLMVNNKFYSAAPEDAFKKHDERSDTKNESTRGLIFDPCPLLDMRMNDADFIGSRIINSQLTLPLEDANFEGAVLVKTRLKLTSKNPRHVSLIGATAADSSVVFNRPSVRANLSAFVGHWPPDARKDIMEAVGGLPENADDADGNMTPYNPDCFKHLNHFVDRTLEEVDQSYSRANAAPDHITTLLSISGESQGELILEDARFSYCTMRDAKLTGAVAFGSTWDNTTLVGADFSKSKFGMPDEVTASTFIRANLSSVRFYEAALHSASFEGANLFGADFQSAVLTHCSFTDAKGLIGNEFKGLDLTGASMPSLLKDFAGIKAIDQLSLQARNLTAVLIGVGLFALFTVYDAGGGSAVAVHDDGVASADDGRIALPILSMRIGAEQFATVAAFAVVAIFGYLHTKLRRIWEEAARLPAYMPDGRRYTSHLYPFALSGVLPFIRRDLQKIDIKRERRTRKSLRTFSDIIEGFAGFIVGWVFAPLTIYLIGLWESRIVSDVKSGQVVLYDWLWVAKPNTTMALLGTFYLSIALLVWALMIISSELRD